MTEKRKTSAGSEDAYQDFHPESYFPTGNYRKREGCLPFFQSPSENKSPSPFMEDSEEAGSPIEQNASVSNGVSTKRISSRQRWLSLEEYRTAFLNALEKIPGMIEQYEDKNETLEKEIPQLQEIAGKVWRKEDELKQLKYELAALDRKIQLELAPPAPENVQKENVEEQQGQSIQAEDFPTQQQADNPTIIFVNNLIPCSILTLKRICT